MAEQRYHIGQAAAPLLYADGSISLWIWFLGGSVEMLLEPSEALSIGRYLVQVSEGKSDG